MRHFDHIVVGTGSMGSAACYYLASRGCKVLGIDQYSVPHELGSHSGQTRIIRKAYFEHPDYIPLLQRAYQNWEHLEQATGAKLFHKTGLLYVAPAGHELLQSVKSSAGLYGIPLHQTAISSYPQFRFDAGHEFLFEPDAGFLLPDEVISQYAACARAEGAELHGNEKIIGWNTKNGNCIVQTDLAEYVCKKLVFTAGPWTAGLIPGIGESLKIHRQILAWIRPKDPVLFNMAKFPCWLSASHEKQGVYYGFPLIPADVSAGPQGIKIALHHPGELTDPFRVNRSVSKEDTEHILDFVNEHFPAAGSDLVSATTCLYSMTPDEHFVIDNLPGHEDHACMAWGFSGHGFKFVSAVGEILADLAMYGNTELPIRFLRHRF